jgi:hypothetical protein
MEELRLNPSWIASGTASTSVPVLKLHEIENTLSSLVASIFWIGQFHFFVIFSILIPVL